MFPPLVLAAKPHEFQGNALFKPVSKVTISGDEGMGPAVPMIPPVVVHDAPTVPTLERDHLPEWFAVLSPREIKGIKGPLSVNDLRQMFQYGDISDRTFVWKEGNKTWQKIHELNYLRHKMLQLPVVPVKAVSFPELPPKSQIPDFQRFSCEWITRFCSVCGNVAVGHSAGKGEQAPVFGLTPVGSTTVASEVIPGLLWIGNGASAKKNPLNQLAITLAVNCTNDLKSPSSRPPYYRHKVAAMTEMPQGKALDNEAEFLYLLEQCFDWIEQERVCREKVALSDVKRPEYTGPTDKFGRPLQRDPESEPPVNRPSFEKEPPPRVLLWSRLGFDRPCVVAIAYLIKFWGLTLSSAVKLVEDARPGTKLSAAYLHALRKWSKTYTLGTLFCEDCIVESIAKEHPEASDASAMLQAIDQVKAAFSEIQELSDVDVEHVFSVAATVEINSAPSSSEAFLSVICDLRLNGRRLGDAVTNELISCLSNLKLTSQIRWLDLSGNCLTSTSVLSLARAFSSLPQDHSYVELIALSLSQNEIGVEGANALSAWLRRNKSLISLDLSGNFLGDAGAHSIIASLGEPDFAGENDHQCESEEAVFNISITDLNLGSNSLGAESGALLAAVLRSNSVLTSLNLDMNPAIPRNAIKSITTALRLNNTSIQRISLSDSKLTVKSLGYLFRTLESSSLHVSWLNLSRSCISGAHMTVAAPSLINAKYLCWLDLSFNPLGDVGAFQLAAALRGSTILESTIQSNSSVASSSMRSNDAFSLMPKDEDEHVHPSQSSLISGKMDFSMDYRRGETPAQHVQHLPLRHLDLNCCGFSSSGSLAVLASVASRPSLKYLDISNNIIGQNISEIAQQLSHCHLKELRMGHCQLQSKGAIALFEILTCGGTKGNDDSSGNIALSLKVLILSNNDIQDSSLSSIGKCLVSNNVLESVDLGFNCLTDECRNMLSSVTEVSSTSSVEQKVLPLNIVMEGNPCSPYVLETPGLSRSKQTCRFGINRVDTKRLNASPARAYQTNESSGKASRMDERILSSLNGVCREQFYERSMLYSQYCEDNPEPIINSIS